MSMTFLCEGQIELRGSYSSSSGDKDKQWDRHSWGSSSSSSSTALSAPRILDCELYQCSKTLILEILSSKTVLHFPHNMCLFPTAPEAPHLISLLVITLYSPTVPSTCIHLRFTIYSTYLAWSVSMPLYYPLLYLSIILPFPTVG